MGLGSWWIDFKIDRIESKLKTAHVRQRQLRDKITQLDAAKKKGDVIGAEYEEKLRKLTAEKHDVTERIATLTREEEALKRAQRATTA